MLGVYYLFGSGESGVEHADSWVLKKNIFGYANLCFEAAPGHRMEARNPIF